MEDMYNPDWEEDNEDYEKESWEKFLTEKEYLSLLPWGREVAEYWTEYLPNMCREMQKEGTLLKNLTKEGETLAEYEAELVHSGLALDGVREMVWERVHELQPEPDNLRMDEEELKEQLDGEMEYQYSMDQYLPEEITTYEQYRKRPEYIAQAKRELEWYLTPEEEKLLSKLDEYRWEKQEIESKLWDLYLEDETTEGMSFEEFSKIPENIAEAKETFEAEQKYFKEMWESGIREF